MLLIDKSKWGKSFVEIVSIIEKMDLHYTGDIKSAHHYFTLIVAILIFNSITTAPFPYKNDFSAVTTSDNVINQLVTNLQNVAIWMEMNHNSKSLDKLVKETLTNSLRRQVWVLLETLSDELIIQRRVVRVENKTYIIYSYNDYFCDIQKATLFNHPFKLYQNPKNTELTSIFSDHYSNLFQLCRKNRQNGHQFHLGNGSVFLEKLMSLRVKIDYVALKKFFINRLNEIGVEGGDLETTYNSLRCQISYSIKLNKTGSLKVLSRKLSTIIDLMRIKRLIDDDNREWIYYPSFLCFRGRIYFSSKASFTFFKELRYVLIGADLTATELLALNSHPLLRRVERCLEPHVQLITQLHDYPPLESFSPLTRCGIVWVLIGIGEMFKVELGAQIHIRDLILKGVAVVNDQVSIAHFDSYHLAKLDKFKLILWEYSRGVFNNHLIGKDSPASCFQILLRTLGGKTAASHV